MAIWEITTAYKKSSIERQFWYKDDKCIIREEGFRWGTFSTESDEKPDVDLANEDGFEVDMGEWEMVSMDDGCWADTELGRNATDEDLQEFEEAWEEDYYEGVEAKGWTLDDSEFELQGPLILTNKDTGEEFSGLVDPATVVHTIELPKVEVNGVEVDLFKDDKPMFDPKPNGNKWPFERPEEGTKEEEVEAIEGFTNLTDWHSAEHYYPTNIGRYQVNSYNSDKWPFPTFAEWDGKKWSDDKVISWRGLASDPGAK